MVFKMNLKVDAIPEIVNIFSNSQNVSYMKGRTHFLMRKRDQIRERKYNDIEMDRKEEDIKAIEEYEKKIKELEDVIDQYDKRESGFLKDKEKLVILYQNGIIDNDVDEIESKNM